MTKPPGIVYKITFADGAVYIGKTYQTLRARMCSHRSRPTNHGISARMNRGIKYTAEILHTATCRQELKDLEMDAILLEAEQADSSMLNVNGLPKCYKSKVEGAQIYRDGRRKRKRSMYAQPGKDRPVVKPSVESALCSICRQWWPAADFHRDRCRHNGLSSRCKACKCDVTKIQRAVKSADAAVRDRLMPTYQRLILAGVSRESAVKQTISEYKAI